MEDVAALTPQVIVEYHQATLLQQRPCHTRIGQHVLGGMATVDVDEVVQVFTIDPVRQLTRQKLGGRSLVLR